MNQFLKFISILERLEGLIWYNIQNLGTSLGPDEESLWDNQKVVLTFYSETYIGSNIWLEEMVLEYSHFPSSSLKNCSCEFWSPGKLLSSFSRASLGLIQFLCLNLFVPLVCSSLISSPFSLYLFPPFSFIFSFLCWASAHPCALPL